MKTQVITIITILFSALLTCAQTTNRVKISPSVDVNQRLQIAWDAHKATDPTLANYQRQIKRLEASMAATEKKAVEQRKMDAAKAQATGQPYISSGHKYPSILPDWNTARMYQGKLKVAELQYKQRMKPIIEKQMSVKK